MLINYLSKNMYYLLNLVKRFSIKYNLNFFKFENAKNSVNQELYVEVRKTI